MAIGFLLLAGCDSSSDDDTDDAVDRAQIRVLQAVVGAPAVDCYHSRSEAFKDFAAVEPLTATGYVSVDAGRYVIVLKEASTGATLAEYPTSFAKATRHLMIASGTPDAMTLNEYDDTAVDVDVGTAMARFVNATADGVPISLTARSPLSQDELFTIAELGSTEENVQSLPSESNIPLVANPLNEAAQHFTLTPFASTTYVTVVAIDSSASMSFIAVPPVSNTNVTTLTEIPENPTALFVDNVPGSVGSALVIDGAASGSLDFGGVSTAQRVPLDFDLTLAGVAGSSRGVLEGSTTYIIVLTPNASALSLQTYSTTIADNTLRVINATVGSAALDVTFAGSTETVSDLVYGALSGPVANSGAITSVTAGSITYPVSIDAHVRYAVLVGEASGSVGLTTLSFADGSWTSAFVAGLH